MNWEGAFDNLSNQGHGSRWQRYTSLAGYCGIDLTHYRTGRKKLHLPRRRRIFKINGVAGFKVRPRGTISFKVAEVRGGGNQIKVEASIFPKVTNDLPTVPASLPSWWKHQSILELVDPNFGIPAGVDILLRGKVFSKAVLRGHQFSSTGSTVSFQDVLWLGTKWWGEWWESTVVDSHLWCWACTLKGSINDR